jgi:hypothetical protein
VAPAAPAAAHQRLDENPSSSSSVDRPLSRTERRRCHGASAGAAQSWFSDSRYDGRRRPATAVGGLETVGASRGGRQPRARRHLDGVGQVEHDA